jgi:hypothetical protein
MITSGQSTRWTAEQHRGQATVVVPAEDHHLGADAVLREGRGCPTLGDDRFDDQVRMVLCHRTDDSGGLVEGALATRFDIGPDRIAVHRPRADGDLPGVQDLEDRPAASGLVGGPVDGRARGGE